MNSKLEEENQLLDVIDALDSEDQDLRLHVRARSSTSRNTISIFSILLNLLLLPLLLFSHLRGPKTCSDASQLIYSPAQEVVTYEIRKFNTGFDLEKSPYQGFPTEETNKLWEELYIHGNSAIPKNQAALLPNKTIVAHPDGSGGYLIVLSVFHDLHCLDHLRKALYYFLDPNWNSTNNPFTLKSFDLLSEDLHLHHMDHCIDNLRQSFQCSSDISPYVYQWSEKHGDVRAFADIVRTCRNFDAVNEWALEHESTADLDVSVRADEQGLCGFGDPASCLTSVE